jgi:hypothetical protein
VPLAAGPKTADGAVLNQSERSPAVKLLVRFLAITLGAALLLTACGYRNPYVYSGPEKSIYVTTWKNRTSELQLDADIYQALIRWFQKSGSISITKQKEGADLILAGEIISYNLPSLTYGANNTASTVKLRLRVRYILKDLKTDTVLIEQSSEEWTEDFRISPDSAFTRDNGDRALETIIENMAQKIYQRSLVQISKLP